MKNIFNTDLSRHTQIVRYVIYFLFGLLIFVLLFRPYVINKQTQKYWVDRLLDNKKLVLRIDEVCVDDRCFTLPESSLYVIEITEDKYCNIKETYKVQFLKVGKY